MNRTGHDIHNSVRIQTEGKFHSATGTAQEEQGPTVDILSCRVGQLAGTVDDSTVNAAVQHPDFYSFRILLLKNPHHP
jgi:hypothetical protein